VHHGYSTTLIVTPGKNLRHDRLVAQRSPTSARSSYEEAHREHRDGRPDRQPRGGSKESAPILDGSLEDYDGEGLPHLIPAIREWP
jgi:hypothetical protein